jgi:hypothetical protein
VGCARPVEGQAVALKKGENIEHPTSNIQHRISEKEGRVKGFQPHAVENIEHSPVFASLRLGKTFNIQHRIKNEPAGRPCPK